MKFLIILSILLPLFSSCRINYDVYNDVLCNAIGDDYMYESFKEFWNQNSNLEKEYDYYLSNRNKKDSSFIYLNDNFYMPLDLSNTKYRLIIRQLDDEQKLLFNKLLKEAKNGPKIKIDSISPCYNYRFKLLSSESISKVKPGERIVFFISRPIFSDNGLLSCFYVAGGRGASGHWDSIFYCIKENGQWRIFDKFEINVF